ncbi:dynein heavy chain KNAG_0C01270 [Huiozyma naganishii CBS 8797]|uniref:Dynein heavy chain, cytoplasmic n=1 Tax=Huiozyma naganishii (strain ATCC MYA-139 / BCRC 22969 / CBS 8797 / KCTC 17520 / NBRC 10181 / NCYC 3082 / Yp74L-3) TaxID=1071383 RepID=J7R331_HUIN7|nr:hypothetical protein KNAG_0C01270 [Kazachstania naganishii CBS 8797]CCK69240.1 hypothetical protein KNAG_0C01270 [Kazachstania naganishii CBS 8797]
MDGDSTDHAYTTEKVVELFARLIRGVCEDAGFSKTQVKEYLCRQECLKQLDLFIHGEETGEFKVAYVLTGSTPDQLHFCVELTNINPNVKTLPHSVTALVKNVRNIDLDSPLKDQLSIISLPAPVNVQALSTLISEGLASLLDILVHFDRKDEFSSANVINTKQKLDDVSTGLQNIKNNIDKPDILGHVEPIISSAVSKGATKETVNNFLKDEIFYDTTFLNNLQTIYNQWVKDTRKLRTFEPPLPFDKTLIEVQNWSNLENVIKETTSQLQGEEVEIICKILSDAKRIKPTFSFLGDTKLKERWDEVMDHNSFLSHIPISELLTCSSITELSECAENISSGLRTYRLSKYSIERFFCLLQCITSEILSQMLNITPNLFRLPGGEFQGVINCMFEVITQWNNVLKEILIQLREVVRRRQLDAELPVTLDHLTENIKNKLKQAEKLLKQRDIMKAAVHNIGITDSTSKIEQVFQPITVLNLPDILDDDVWDSSSQDYYKKFLDLEFVFNIGVLGIVYEVYLLIKVLSETIKYKPLMAFSPRIKSKVKELQYIVLNSTKLEILSLEKQLINQTHCIDTELQKNVPNVAATISEFDQYHKVIDRITSQVQMILGLNWGEYPDGAIIEKCCRDIKKRTNIDDIIGNWLKTATFSNTDNESPQLLKIVTERSGSYSISVKVERNGIQIIQNTRCLISMGYELPTEIMRRVKNHKELYAYASHISELIQTFLEVCDDILKHRYSSILILSATNVIWDDIKVLMTEQWNGSDTKRNQAFVNRFDHNITELTEKSRELKTIDLEFSEQFEKLKSLPFNIEQSACFVSNIQGIVNKIEKSDSVDAKKLVNNLNSMLIRTIIANVKQNISFILMKQTKFSIKYTNKNIFCQPTISEIRRLWIITIEDFITDLSTFKLLGGKYTKDNAQFSLAVVRRSLTDDFNNVLKAIGILCNEASDYLRQWRSTEKLLTFNEYTFKTHFEMTLVTGCSLLEHVLASKNAIEMLAKTTNIRGIIQFDVNEVYTFVSTKYDYWVAFILEPLQDLYTKDVSLFLEELSTERSILEENSDNCKVLQIVGKSVEIINKNQKLKKDRELKCSLFLKFQQLLSKTNSRFPSNFIYYDQIEGACCMLDQSIVRQTHFLENNKDEILQTITSTASNLMELRNTFVEDWVELKKEMDSFEPHKALHCISLRKLELQEMGASLTLIKETAELLNLPLPLDISFDGLLNEVRIFKDVWMSIRKMWEEINDQLQTKWGNVSIPYTIQLLQRVSHNLKQLTGLSSGSSVVASLTKRVFDILDTRDILELLKGPSIKSRHWKILFRDFSFGSRTDDYILKDEAFSFREVLGLRLATNRNAIMTVIENSEKEYVIEKSLSRMQKYWEKTMLICKVHPSGLKLVGQWSDIQESCKEGLEELSSIRNSPYSKLFETSRLEWETKLNLFLSISLTWMDAQSFWLDLYGVLGKNGTLSKLSPLEASKFNILSRDFKELSERAFSLQRAIDVVAIPNLPDSFKKILHSLLAIKTSLKVFLEGQRKQFPRFHFIGDEDLLKIIGASTDINVISQYIPKMFTSIKSLQMSDSHLISFTSMEGEVINLKNPVKVELDNQLHEWLSHFAQEVQLTIEGGLKSCLSEVSNCEAFDMLITKHAFQVVLLTFQITMTRELDTAIQTVEFLKAKNIIQETVNAFGVVLKSGLSALNRRKIEAFYNEILHFCDIIEKLTNEDDTTRRSLYWHRCQRFYYDAKILNPLSRVTVVQCGYTNQYGFDYIGVPERLVYTPVLMDSFAFLTGAHGQKMGGSFFGPAGTGKTETIKALGQNLGKVVIVFNCDDTYDFNTVSRLLLGVAQIGAWGCFDEFNRLEQKVLSSSAVNLEMIQKGLTDSLPNIDIMGMSSPLHPQTAIFITLNPEYQGRSVLPENLKRKFHEFWIGAPEQRYIASSILQLLGYVDAEKNADRIVTLFDCLKKKCSPQRHYDFSLRTLKRVLKNCSKYKDESYSSDDILVTSLSEIILPTLNVSDATLFQELINEIFGSSSMLNADQNLIEVLESICKSEFLLPTKNFVQKCVQLYEITKTQPAVILVGKAGSGKTETWKTVLAAKSKIEHIQNVPYIIDSKVLSKEELYGSLNRATLEWKDGIFTSIIRANQNKSALDPDNPNVWIVLDSDMDPSYSETINSVLDDNKILTLPNGERLPVPSNVRFIFETSELIHATPATITRCGLIWFSEPNYLLYDHFLNTLDKHFSEFQDTINIPISFFEDSFFRIKAILNGTMWGKMIERYTAIEEHIMENNLVGIVSAIVTALSSFLVDHYSTLAKFDLKRRDEVLSLKLQQIIITFFGGDCYRTSQDEFSTSIMEIFQTTPERIDPREIILSKQNLDVLPLSSLVPKVDLNSCDILRPDIIIPTPDTVRQKDVFFDLLKSGTSIILCGPPGAGKTMIVNDTLRNSDFFFVVGMNFSKETSVRDVLRVLERFTVYIPNSIGYTLQPSSISRDLVFFCDEINLPALDSYESQPVILFLRQLIEKKGFWLTNDNKWVNLERIHVIGACNPPGDPGRVPLTQRMTRLTSVMYFDYPNQASLECIYSTYYNAVFTLVPTLKGFAKDFSKASIHLYNECKKTFSPKKYSHYILTPRELTRWVKGFYHGISNGPIHTLTTILRLWAYESWRIFGDKLVSTIEKQMFEKLLHSTLSIHFPDCPVGNIESEALLFSSWFTSEYTEVSKEELWSFVAQRFQTFCEEESDVPVVIHSSMLDHILRVDRILRNSQGHGMLIGPPRTGKATVTKFVAWINGYKAVQPLMHRKYTLGDFDDFLRDVLLKCCVGEQRICLLIDESNILESSFLERMNTLLANSDIPDLFQGDEFEKLMMELTKKINFLGLLIETYEEKYEWFVNSISKNLHVIFTVSDPYASNKLSSPALFNRCVINWMGPWDLKTRFAVGSGLIKHVPINFKEHKLPNSDKSWILPSKCASFYDVLLNIMISFDEQFDSDIVHVGGSPCYLVDTLNIFKTICEKRYLLLLEKGRFVSIGLEKLNESVLKVKALSKKLGEKKEELQLKESESRKTLDMLLEQQNESERKQDVTDDIKKILLVHEKETRESYETIERDLRAIEPTVIDAQNGVKNIKKQHLTEIRSMNNPPSSIKILMEAVCLVLGFDFHSWREIQSFVRKDSFIYDIVHYDAATMMTPQIRLFIEQTYFSQDKFTYEVINRASKATGPLFQWVRAQVKYASVLQSIGPLRESSRKAEEDMMHARARLLAAEEMVEDLKQNVEQLKGKYSSLIRDTELIKSELEKVEGDLGRSVALVEKLASEKYRWRANTQLFKTERNQLIGNAIISSIYTTYFGQIDEKRRHKMIKYLFATMRDCNVEYDANYMYSKYDISPVESAKWMECGLPHNDFYITNFHLLINSVTQVPYFLDPSGDIIKVLSSLFQSNLVIISFVETGFVKRLENAVKFGASVLIKDGEFFDPIISKLITFEHKKIGGKEVVRIGNHDVDVSPGFRLFIHSRDVNSPLPLFLKTRVRLIDFSATKGNIEVQAVHTALFNENSEIQTKRDKLVKVNDEYRIRLSHLEKLLLQELNSTEGNILDNTNLVTTLENIKKESDGINAKLKESTNFMEEYMHLFDEYSILGHHCIQVYSIIEALSKFHWFYETPIWQFMECFEAVFRTKQSTNSSRPQRISQLTEHFYKEIYSRISVTFDQRTRKVFAIVLYLSYWFSTNDLPSKVSLNRILDILRTGDITDSGADLGEYLLQTNSEDLQELATMWKNGNLTALFDKFQSFFGNETRLETMMQYHKNLGLIMANKDELDGSSKFENTAHRTKQKLTTIPLGSVESTEYAEKMLNQGQKSGTCILLQNLQFSMDWVNSYLVTECSSLQGDNADNTKALFMTCNFSSQELPAPLLQTCYKYVFEEESNVLEMVKEYWFNESYTSKSEAHVGEFYYYKYFLTWLHAIITGRNKLAPFGFSRKYDITDTAYNTCLKFLDNLLESISDRNVFVQLLQFFADTIVYGGKISDVRDRTILKDICQQVFHGTHHQNDTLAAHAVKTGVTPIKILQGMSFPKITDNFINKPTIDGMLGGIELAPNAASSWLGIPQEEIQEHQRQQLQQVLNIALDTFRYTAIV